MASTDFADLVGQSQKQALAALKQTQELLLKATQVAVRAAPSAPAAWLARPEAAKQTVESSFDFAAQVLDEYRRFGLRMTDVLVNGGDISAKA